MKQKRLFAGLLVVALTLALVQAVRFRWICDDAFISFRYARNLLDGLGLVWNAGERVEGYTNFLWTLWCGVGIACGARPEIWSIVWGIVFHLGVIAALGCHLALLHQALRPRTLPIPLAAFLAAAHTDWSIYATSGLETSAFLFFSLAGALLLEKALLGGRPRPASAALVFLLATLVRPDGILFAAAAGIAFLAFTKPGLRNAARFSIAFAIPFAAFLLWRFAYYGDWLPNTYYAKSAARAWWSQGWIYLGLYFEKYGVLLLSFPLALGAAARRPSGEEGAPDLRAARLLLLVEAGFAVVYGVYVTRVGGDFMYARLLLPSTCFLVLLMETAITILFSRSSVRYALAGLVVLAALVLPPSPMKGSEQRQGIVSERQIYGAKLVDERGTPEARQLRDYLRGTNVRVASLGGQAHLMYRAAIPIAIESATGLTDRVIARQPLAERGRVGHEKRANLDYLIGVRRAHFIFHPRADVILKLGERIPLYTIEVGGVRGWILHWDPALMAELGARGVRFPDVPADIDACAAALDTMTYGKAACLYAKLKLFYFDPVSDPKRETLFLRRLEEAP